MQLIQSNNNIPSITVRCICKDHIGNRYIEIEDVYIDIDGVPFKDYYCKTCVDEYFKEFICQLCCY